jgi:hypothetical protein
MAAQRPFADDPSDVWVSARILKYAQEEKLAAPSLASEDNGEGADRITQEEDDAAIAHEAKNVGNICSRVWARTREGVNADSNIQFTQVRDVLYLLSF